ncbi:MAG: hypothetical protein RLO50_07150 [Azospirillaceae bacterium]
MTHWGKYVWGMVIGAAVVLILGFSVGPLTTSGNAAEMASSAADERNAAFCLANARRMIATGDADAPTSTSERTDLARASLENLLPGVEIDNASVRVCSRVLTDL